MRPGQEAPDDVHPMADIDLKAIKASMRPGQEAPDDGHKGGLRGRGRAGFNEAGARSPG